MQEIGTPKIGWNKMILHIKRPRITVNYRIGSIKKHISQLHIPEIADKKTSYNKGKILLNIIFFWLGQQKMHLPYYIF